MSLSIYMKKKKLKTIVKNNPHEFLNSSQLWQMQQSESVPILRLQSCKVYTSYDANKTRCTELFFYKEINDTVHTGHE